MRQLGMFEQARRIVIRQFVLVSRTPMEIATPLAFFIMSLLLFPLGFGPSAQHASSSDSGVIWVVALLASLISSDRIFRQDFDDGCLDQLLISPQPIFASALAYTFAHWSQTGLPLAIISPVAAIMFGLSGSVMLILFVSLMIGTFVLSLIGAIGAALTLGIRKGGVLTAIIILPLYLPVLIFGVAAVEASQQGALISPAFLLLLAIASGTIALGPLAIGAALKISAEA